MYASAPGDGTDSGRISSAFSTPKIAVFAPTQIASDRMAAAVNAGWRRIDRTAYRKSRARSSSHRMPCASRVASLIGSMPPNVAIAIRRASSRDTPSAMRRFVSSSTWNRSSASSWRSKPLRSRTRVHRLIVLLRSCHARSQDQSDRFGYAAPVGDLCVETRTALLRQPVHLRVAAGFRLRPLGREQSLVFEPVQGGVQGTLRYLQKRSGYPI